MTYLSTVLADSPVHYWRCADTGGVLLADVGSSPLKLTCSVNFELLGYSGIASDGGAFAVINTAIAWAPDLVAVAAPFSIEMWCYPLSRRLGANQQLLTADNDAVPLLNLMYLGTGAFRFNIGNNPMTSPTIHPIQQWYHVVGTYSAANGPKLFVNSINEVSGASQGALAPSAQFRFGVSTGSLGASVLTECAYYNVELTPTQVTNHFLAGVTTSGPVFQLPGVPTSGGGISSNADVLAALNGDLISTYVNNP